MQGNTSSRNKRRMCYFNSSNDMWLRTVAKSWKYKSVILICGLQMFFITKPVTADMFIFIPKENIKEVSRQSAEKGILGLDKKENCDIKKLLSCIWPSCSTPTIVWNVLCQQKHQETTKRWNILPKKNFIELIYASMLNSWEPNRGSCTWSESCRLCYRINHRSWAAW